MAGVRHERVAARVADDHALDHGAPGGVAEPVEVQPVPAEHRRGDGRGAVRAPPGLLGVGARPDPAQRGVPDVGPAGAGEVDVGAALGAALDPDAAGEIEQFGADGDAPSGGDPGVRVLERGRQGDGGSADGPYGDEVVGGGEAVLVGRAGRGDGQFVAGEPAGGRGGQVDDGVTGPELALGADPGGLCGAVQPQVAGAGDPEADVGVDHFHAVALEALLVDGGEAEGVDPVAVGGEGEGAADLDVARGGEGEGAVGGEGEAAARLDQQGADLGVGVEQDLVGDPDGAARSGRAAAPAGPVGPAAAALVDGGRGGGLLGRSGARGGGGVRRGGAVAAVLAHRGGLPGRAGADDGGRGDQPGLAGQRAAQDLLAADRREGGADGQPAQ